MHMSQLKKPVIIKCRHLTPSQPTKQNSLVGHKIGSHLMFLGFLTGSKVIKLNLIILKQKTCFFHGSNAIISQFGVIITQK